MCEDPYCDIFSKDFQKFNNDEVWFSQTQKRQVYFFAIWKLWTQTTPCGNFSFFSVCSQEGHSFPVWIVTFTSGFTCKFINVVGCELQMSEPLIRSNPHTKKEYNSRPKKILFLSVFCTKFHSKIHKHTMTQTTNFENIRS